MSASIARRADAEHGGLHILLLDPAFRLPDQPTPARSFDLAVRLERAGHRVGVITAGPQPDQSLSNQAAIPRIAVDAVTVTDRARAGYPLPHGWINRFRRAAAWRIWRQPDVDVVVAADCPPSLLLAAAAFCLVRGLPLILDVRRVPEDVSPTASFGARLQDLCRGAAFRIAARYARRVFASTPEIRDHLLHAGAAPGKVAVSPFGCDDALAKDVAAWGPKESDFRFPAHIAGGSLVLYSGPMDADVRLEAVIGIAKALWSEARQNPVTFVFCGGGPGRAGFEALARDAGVFEKNVWFLDPIPRRHLPGALGIASAVLVNSVCPSAESSAGFYDGLAAHKPLVVLDHGPYRELIEARGAGIGLPDNPSDDPSIAMRELADFLDDQDGLRRARQQSAALAAGRFNLERIATEFRTALEDTVAEAPRAVVLRNRMLRTKRAIDMVVAATALVILSPVLALLAAAVWIKLGWPPVFSQLRPGLRGELFRIYKFRTMTTAKDSSGALLPDVARLTPLGKFLRRTSLDELPELVNVLRGDMSLVGPRPLLPEYLPHYNTEQRQRHDLRPGITGWSQVNGRNALSWEEKFKLDVWYVENVSLWLDLKIILKTFWIAITGRGVAARGHATMPRFDEIMARREGAED